MIKIPIKNRIKYKVQEIREYITLKFLILFKYLGKDYEPLKCTRCGCKDIEEVTIDTINSVTCESKVICKRCGKELGYWSYGYWIP